MPRNILIRGGMVIDGLGRPGELTDIAIAGDRIARIGRALSGEAARISERRGAVAAVP